jgi:hypothetical protein
MIWEKISKEGMNELVVVLQDMMMIGRYQPNI